MSEDLSKEVIKAVTENLAEITKHEGEIVKQSTQGNGLYVKFKSGNIYRIGLLSKQTSSVVLDKSYQSHNSSDEK